MIEQEDQAPRVRYWDDSEITDLFQRFKKIPPQFVSALDYDKLAQENDRLKAETARACVIGKYCRKHQFIHGGEAEELRQRLEGIDPHVNAVLDAVDARDSLAWLEIKAADAAVASSA